MDQHPTIDLAREAPFRLGAVSVVPSACEVERNGQVQSLEPRIMQVLVLLARANGSVVSREKLIEHCWGGRIVGENAVNRVISRVRNLAVTLGKDSFALETITKVGYRLSLHEPVPDAAVGEVKSSVRRGMDRRSAIAGGVAAVGAVGLAGGWMSGWFQGHQPTREVRLLVAKAREAQGQLSHGQVKQSIAFFQEAVRLDPDYAEAWGGLALSYANLAEFADDPDVEPIAARIRSAARRSLKIDAGNADAEVALILITPHFRNWADVERDCRRGLTRHRDHVRLRGKIPRLMCDTGRWREGAAGFERLVRAEPYRIPLHNQLVLALWGAGRLEEAEHALATASNLWPEHPAIMGTRFRFLALTGDPAAAMRGVGSPGNSMTNKQAELSRLIAGAMSTGRAEHRAQAADSVFSAWRSDEISADVAVQYLAAFGDVDRSFALLNDYFFGVPAIEGRPRTPPGRMGRRETDMLFASPTAPLRRDRRFAALTAAIGLDDYWKATGSLPDWRR